MPETQVVAAPKPTMLTSWRWGNLASVAASAVNSFVIPTGDNIHAIMLYFRSIVPAALTRAQLITDVASVRCWLNGELIYDRTATENLDDYLYDYSRNVALAAPLGVMVIPFTNDWLPVWDQRRGSALGMLKTGGKPGVGPYNTLTMEVTMTAGVATAAACEVHVVTDLYDQEPTGMHVRRLRTTRDLMAIGDNFVQDLPRNATGLLGVRLTDVNVSRVDVMADNRYIYRDLEIQTHQVMQHMSGRTPQVATYSDLRFDLGDDIWSFLPLQGLSKLVFNFNAAAVAPGAGTVICTEEVWDHVRE